MVKRVQRVIRRNVAICCIRMLPMFGSWKHLRCLSTSEALHITISGMDAVLLKNYAGVKCTRCIRALRFNQLSRFVFEWLTDLCRARSSVRNFSWPHEERPGWQRVKGGVRRRWTKGRSSLFPSSPPFVVPSMFKNALSLTNLKRSPSVRFLVATRMVRALGPFRNWLERHIKGWREFCSFFTIQPFALQVREMRKIILQPVGYS